MPPAGRAHSRTGGTTWLTGERRSEGSVRTRRGRACVRALKRRVTTTCLRLSAAGRVGLRCPADSRRALSHSGGRVAAHGTHSAERPRTGLDHPMAASPQVGDHIRARDGPRRRSPRVRLLRIERARGTRWCGSRGRRSPPAGSSRPARGQSRNVELPLVLLVAAGRAEGQHRLTTARPPSTATGWSGDVARAPAWSGIPAARVIICSLVPSGKPRPGMTGDECSQPPLGVADDHRSPAVDDVDVAGVALSPGRTRPGTSMLPARSRPAMSKPYGRGWALRSPRRVPRARSSPGRADATEDAECDRREQPGRNSYEARSPIRSRRSAAYSADSRVVTGVSPESP